MQLAKKMNKITFMVTILLSPISALGPYTDNGDNTVTDTTTNLRWQKCSRGQNNDASCSGVPTMPGWQVALQYCDTLNLGSFANSSNWRLPSVKELKSLVHAAVSSSTIKSAYFPSAGANAYWTASTVVTAPGNAWVVHFSDGSVSTFTKTMPAFVRCVATGP